MKNKIGREIIEIAVFGWKNFIFENLIAILLLLLLCIGTAVNSFLYTILYLAIVSLSRRFVKGFHFDKRWKCMSATVISHSMLFLMANIFRNILSMNVVCTAIIFSSTYILLDCFLQLTVRDC